MPRRSSRRTLPAASRRDFLAISAAVSAGYWIAPEVRAQDGKPATSANEEIRFGCIGIGGKGQSDSADAARHGKVVAVADVDSNQLKRGEKAFEGTKTYSDFRVMIDEMGKEIDAVTVSTPDHTHTVAASMAMELGKHCFCQKPLTKSIAEARFLGDLARSKKVATQMGNQGTAAPSLRKAASFIKGGGLGTVKEVHVWTNRPVWPQGGDRPAEAPVPPNLDWNSWLGQPRCGPMAWATIPSHGAASGILAPEPWATWPATRLTCRLWRSISAIRPECRPTPAATTKRPIPSGR